MKSAIRKAFSQARKPESNEITRCPCDECQELAIFFGKFDPGRVSIYDLRQNETFLLHGTSIAFRYFLPFFLELSVQDLSKAGAIPDLIVAAFSTDFKHLDRISLLSISEVECVEEYFDLLVKRGEYEEEDEELCCARQSLDKLAKRLSDGWR